MGMLVDMTVQRLHNLLMINDVLSADGETGRQCEFVCGSS